MVRLTIQHLIGLGAPKADLYLDPLRNSARRHGPVQGLGDSHALKSHEGGRGQAQRCECVARISAEGALCGETAPSLAHKHHLLQHTRHPHCRLDRHDIVLLRPHRRVDGGHEPRPAGTARH